LDKSIGEMSIKETAAGSSKLGYLTYVVPRAVEGDAVLKRELKQTPTCNDEFVRKSISS
jgi:hypothetical protein